MKVSPVSADLLIKLGIGVLVLGVGYYLVNRTAGSLSDALERFKSGISDQVNSVRQTVSDTIDSVTSAPARVVDWAATEADARGRESQNRYEPQSPAIQQAGGRKYADPHINDDGMDFSLLSG